MLLAAMIKGTDIEDLPGLVAYYKRALKKLGVDIKLGVEVDAELVNRAKPEAVIIAAGSILTKPAVPGIEQRLVLSNTVLHRRAKQVLRFVGPDFLGTVTKTYLPFGKKVVVIGGLMQGLELAEFLVKRGRDVTVLEESDTLGAGMHDFNRNRLIPWLREKGVTLLTGVQFEEIMAKGIAVIQNGARLFFLADNIIIATPPAPNPDLFNQIKKQGKETYVLGDAKEPRNILDAISDGFNIGRTI
jgi:2-enoate reductase